jgi:hypothetical protein
LRLKAKNVKDLSKLLPKFPRLGVHHKLKEYSDMAQPGQRRQQAAQMGNRLSPSVGENGILAGKRLVIT